MKSTSIDTVLEVRLRHEPGTLARVAAAIAEHQGLLCEIAINNALAFPSLVPLDRALHDAVAEAVARCATGMANTAAP